MKKGTVAIIDIGANSFQVQVMQEDGDSRVRTIFRRREIMRLLDFSEKSSLYMSGEKISAGIVMLAEFLQEISPFDPEIIATATSSVRDSPNGEEFVAAVRSEIGLPIIVLSGNQEAEYIFKGAFTQNTPDEESLLVFDIGGGSTEIIAGNRKGILSKKSYQAGVVRCSNLFFPAYIITEAGRTGLEKYLTNTFSDIRFLPDGPYKFAGTSGAIRNTVSLAERRFGGGVNGRKPGSLRMEEVSLLEKEICVLSRPEDRKHILPEDPLRTDVMPCSLFILSFLMRKLKIPELEYSAYGLREGIALSFFQENT